MTKKLLGAIPMTTETSPWCLSLTQSPPYDLRGNNTGKQLFVYLPKPLIWLEYLTPDYTIDASTVKFSGVLRSNLPTTCINTPLSSFPQSTYDFEVWLREVVVNDDPVNNLLGRTALGRFSADYDGTFTPINNLEQLFTQTLFLGGNVSSLTVY
jgi:hypothetical protein